MQWLARGPKRKQPLYSGRASYFGRDEATTGTVRKHQLHLRLRQRGAVHPATKAFNCISNVPRKIAAQSQCPKSCSWGFWYICGLAKRYTTKELEPPALRRSQSPPGCRGHCAWYP